MITIYRREDASTKGNEKEYEIRGLSTDTKPTTVDSNKTSNGTVFIEIDTGKMYLYDQENEQWKEV